jgi:hypothetical protein
LALENVFESKPVSDAVVDAAVNAFLSIPLAIRQQYTPFLSKLNTSSVTKLLANVPAAFSGAPGGPPVGGRAHQSFHRPRYGR